MLSSSRDALLKLPKTTSPQKLIPSDCIPMFIWRKRYSVTQSKSTSSLGYVVLDSFDKVYGDEDSILDQMYKKQIFSSFYSEDLK